MGLAASQARLLMITARVNDCQFNLMKLSGEQLLMTTKEDDIVNKKQDMLNKMDMSYAGSTDFNYMDLMGQSGFNMGCEGPTMITDASNKVVLDSSLAAAMRASGSVEGKKGSASETGFANFMSAMTGDNTVDWAKTYYGTTTTTTTTGADETQKYKDANKYCTDTYGEEPDAPEWIDEVDDYEDIRQTVNNNQDRPGNKGIPNKQFTDQITPLGGHMYYPKNSKGYTLEQWTSKIQSYASSNGLQYNYLVNGTAPSPTTTTTTTTKPDTTSDNYKKADYFYTIYSDAVTNGWTMDEKINDSDYLKAQLKNNNYKIDGKLAADNEDVKDAMPDTDLINDWYDEEMRKISNQEKAITSKQTLIQTQLSALETERSSVQSLIDKNIERSFTYCQNG